MNENEREEILGFITDMREKIYDGSEGKSNVLIVAHVRYTWNS